MMSFSARVNSLLCLLALSIGFSAAWLGGDAAETALRKELLNRGDFISSALVEAYANRVAENDLLPVIEGINAIAEENQDIAYVYVTGYDQRLVAHSFKDGFPVELQSIWATTDDQRSSVNITNRSSYENFLEIRKPLIEGLQGFVHVGLSLRRTENDVLEVQQRILLSTLIITLVLILISFFLSKRITQPLLALTELTYRFAHGEQLSEKDVQIKSGGHEIESLSSAFRYMLHERRVNEEQIAFLAYHDNLTELPNLLLLRERLEQLILSHQRSQSVFALMFLDLDNFKSVNDSLGHPIGDKLLKAVSQRLLAVLRQPDTIARIGGDEFVILLDNIGSELNACGVAQKILNEFKTPHQIDSYELHASWSIGLSLFPKDGIDGASLIKNADAAMYCAKKLGKNNFQLYSKDMAEQANERFIIESQLRTAVEKGELELYYQPQVSLNEPGSITVEALIRWNHPIYGIIPPDKFIPIAEETRAIIDIGEWIIRTACFQMNDWKARNIGIKAIAINISFVQLQLGELIQTLDNVMDETKTDPHSIELEITESSIMKDSDQAVEILNQAVERGFKLSIDDFGTGYSSLSQLKSMPIHKLKIDKSFVDDVPGDVDDETVIESIITLAHNLGLEVIAEGVETHQQLSFLLSKGCSKYQGYLYCKPLPARKLEKKLRRSKSFS